MKTKLKPEFNSKGQDFLGKIVQDSNVQILAKENTLQSLYPAESLFGYTYFSHLIPPYKPESVLILGYGQGTCADLIRKIWGSDVKITGVDILPNMSGNTEYQHLVMDALKYVRECSSDLLKRRFDYVIVDLWEGDEIPEFVFTDEFVCMLREITTRLLAINVKMEDFNNLKPYHEYGFDFHRFVQIFNNCVSFWGIASDTK